MLEHRILLSFDHSYQLRIHPQKSSTILIFIAIYILILFNYFLFIWNIQFFGYLFLLTNSVVITRALGFLLKITISFKSDVMMIIIVIVLMEVFQNFLILNA